MANEPDVTTFDGIEKFAVWQNGNANRYYLQVHQKGTKRNMALKMYLGPVQRVAEIVDLYLAGGPGGSMAQWGGPMKDMKDWLREAEIAEGNIQVFKEDGDKPDMLWFHTVIIRRGVRSTKHYRIYLNGERTLANNPSPHVFKLYAKFPEIQDYASVPPPRAAQQASIRSKAVHIAPKLVGEAPPSGDWETCSRSQSFTPHYVHKGEKCLLSGTKNERRKSCWYHTDGSAPVMSPSFFYDNRDYAIPDAVLSEPQDDDADMRDWGTDDEVDDQPGVQPGVVNNEPDNDDGVRSTRSGRTYKMFQTSNSAPGVAGKGAIGRSAATKSAGTDAVGIAKSTRSKSAGTSKAGVKKSVKPTNNKSAAGKRTGKAKTPNMSGKTTGGIKSGKPDGAQKPGGAQEPVDTQEPAGAKKPAHAQKSRGAQESGGVQEPARAQEPAGAQKPARVRKPRGAQKPGKSAVAPNVEKSST